MTDHAWELRAAIEEVEMMLNGGCTFMLTRSRWRLEGSFANPHLPLDV